MLNIIDMINESNILTENSVLVRFDIANIFPSIDNVSGLEAVCEILENRETDFPPAKCILQDLSYVRNTASLYFMRSFIYKKMTLL